jgi:hypothetical protein
MIDVVYSSQGRIVYWGEVTVRRKGMEEVDDGK